MAGMDQEIITPEKTPAAGSHASTVAGSFVAAAGTTLMALTMFGSASAATIWAFSNLFGFPEIVMWTLMGLSAIPVLWATVWTAGRAWHIERRLEQGLDVDQPVFQVLYYWKEKES